MLEADGLTDEYEDFKSNNKATAEAIAAEKETRAFGDSLKGTVADNIENLAKYEEMLNSFLTGFENCLKGTHNFDNYEITTPAKCGENAIETSTCWFCGETDEREAEGTALAHDYTAVLTRPTETEQGYYTYTCSACGDTYTEDVESADYSALNDAVAAIEELLADEMLTDEAVADYTAQLEALKEGIAADRIASEQDEIDALVDQVNAIRSELDADIKAGTAVMGDIARVENVLETALAGELTEEQRAALEQVEADLATLTQQGPVTQAQVNILLVRIDNIVNREVQPDAPATEKNDSLHILIKLIANIIDILLTIVRFFAAA